MFPLTSNGIQTLNQTWRVWYRSLGNLVSWSVAFGFELADSNYEYSFEVDSFVLSSNTFICSWFPHLLFNWLYNFFLSIWWKTMHFYIPAYTYNTFSNFEGVVVTRSCIVILAENMLSPITSIKCFINKWAKYANLKIITNNHTWHESNLQHNF